MSWTRQRLVMVLSIGLVAALALVGGLVITVWNLLTTTDDGTSVDAAAPAPAVSRRDGLASEPMAQVPADAAFSPDPSLVIPPSMRVPLATEGRGPAGVPTGFPQTPQGAVAQLAAIEQIVLEAMSLPVTREVHAAWTLPGAPTFEEWEMTVNVQAFLGSGLQGGLEKDATTVVTATPAAAIVKGADGPDWVVACVLLDVQVSIRTDARMGYGHCSRMQWSEGRWQIAPGAAPAPAPSAWPGSVAAVEAGWLTWEEAVR
jgi:hypothetical protein